MAETTVQQEKKEEKSRRRTMEQERAQFAWRNVSALPESLKGKYKDIVRKFPSLVQNNGLGQALAFLLAKGTDKKGEKPDQSKEHGRLYLHLQEWICEDQRLLPEEKKGPFWLIGGLIAVDSTRYRHVTLEVLGISGWLKRFAEALAPED